jgi:predicted ATPase
MLDRSIASFVAHTPASGLTFSDRGFPTPCAYARLIGLSDDAYIMDACRQCRYVSLVFLAPPWREIYETDSERKQDFAEAERTFHQTMEVYRQCE